MQHAISDMETLAVRLFIVSLMYSPDGNNLYGSGGREFEGRVGVGVESRKVVCLGDTSYSRDIFAIRCIV